MNCSISVHTNYFEKSSKVSNINFDEEKIMHVQIKKNRKGVNITELTD